VAVNLADCAISHDAFHVWIARYGVKYPFENIGFDPMSEAFENGVPVAKFERKITPWGTGSGNPQNRLHEKTAVPARAAGVALLAKTMWFHQSPLGIADNKTLAQHSNLAF
jgi:hypothetical protein